MTKLSFTASCATGLEILVREEVQNFGGENVTTAPGAVFWDGDKESGYRCCLWSRFASRVFLQLHRFTFADEQSLYLQSKEFDWDLVMDTDTSSFAVNCTITGTSPVTHSRFAALRIKDGLVDRTRMITGSRPRVEPRRPDLQLHLHLENTDGILALDLSGESLHRRGYRSSSGPAPLKETLAAAIVALSGWDSTGGENMVDPMCGTGSLLIEAALMFGDSAPGLSRNYFGFYGWRGHDEELWQQLVTEAVAREERAFSRKWPSFIGFDSNEEVLRAARDNVRRAGLEDYIHLQQAELVTLQVAKTPGTILANLPYGERLSEMEVVTRLYRAYGRIVQQRCSGWRVAALIANPELTDSFGISWDHRYKLFNGSIPCRLLVGTASPLAAEPFVWTMTGDKVSPEAQDFANRLQKNLKKILKWSAREDIYCFRVYDRDLPDYNIAIDFYEKWIHVQEYAPPATVDPLVAEKRLRLALQVIRQLLGVRSDRIFVKTRKRQRGRQQYQKNQKKSKLYEIREGNCHLLVNFTDYLDTGLFLDHRPVRTMIFNRARAADFLNLFGYTGSATVHAAAGGATRTTTVDLSENYLKWARMNLANNGFGEQNHRLVVADCLEWLRRDQSHYDLIFVDPPTFSNTKKKRRVFDLQRDHVTLLQLAMARLRHQGVLVFSTNYSRFVLAEELDDLYQVTDITADSIPFDFSRRPHIHRCWEIRHQAPRHAG